MTEERILKIVAVLKEIRDGFSRKNRTIIDEIIKKLEANDIMGARQIIAINHYDIKNHVERKGEFEDFLRELDDKILGKRKKSAARAEPQPARTEEQRISQQVQPVTARPSRNIISRIVSGISRLSPARLFKREPPKDGTVLSIGEVAAEINNSFNTLKKIRDQIFEITTSKRESLYHDFLPAYKRRIRDFSFLGDKEAPEHENIGVQEQDAIKLLKMEKSFETDLIELYNFELGMLDSKKKEGRIYKWYGAVLALNLNSESQQNIVAGTRQVVEELADTVNSACECTLRCFKVAKSEEHAESVIKELDKEKNVLKWIEEKRIVKWRDIDEMSVDSLTKLFSRESALLVELDRWLTYQDNLIQRILINISILARQLPQTVRHSQLTHGINQAKAELSNGLDRFLGEE